MILRTLGTPAVVAVWLLGLGVIGLVTYLAWLGAVAATGFIVPGEIGALELIPAALIGLTPLGWYLWVTILEPLRLGGVEG